MSTSRDPEDFMPNLLDLLREAKKAVAVTADERVLQGFKSMEKELETIKDMNLVSTIKLFEQERLMPFTSLESRLRDIISGAESTYSNIGAIHDALDQMNTDIQQITKVSNRLMELMSLTKRLADQQVLGSQLENQSGLDQKMSQEWSQLGLEERIRESGAIANIRRSYADLESTNLKLCFLSLSVFPEGCVIKKRILIYWWIGEGFITSTQDGKTAEQVGEDIFNKLMRKGLISQPGSSESSAIANKCVMHPWIRRSLIALATEAKFFHFDSSWPRMPSYNMSTCRRACLVSDNPISPHYARDDLLTVFNVNEQFLSMEHELLNKLKKVAVLQLGRWQISPTYHIELLDKGFLEGLGAQKHLKYLSLRGISRITHLPSSILNLISLEILDLRACHDLQMLPSDISQLRKLTHLDVSECYLLGRLPKGIERLSSLQVLKGFLIGSLKNTPCRLSALAKLTNLKRLSIHIENEAVVKDGEFKDLQSISSLRRLKISWGGVSEKIVLHSKEFRFPPDLEKLDLEAIPLPRVPEWLNPRELKNLKKLYIRGGKLDSLEHEGTERWTVEILRLQYLGKLQTESQRLRLLFPVLVHLERIKCHEI